MVEIWLPYGETEYSMELPDPIDLRLSPKIHPSKTSKDQVISKINNFLNDIESPNIYIDETLSQHEKKVLKDLIKIPNVNYVNSVDKCNVILSLVRQESFLGFRGTITSYYLIKNWSQLREAFLSEQLTIDEVIDKAINNFPNKLYTIDVILSGDSPIDVECGVGTSGWYNIINRYKRLWQIKVGFSPIVIASLGGYPSDSNIINILLSIIKIGELSSGEIEALFIIGDGSKELTIDPTKTVKIRSHDVLSYHDLILYTFKYKIKEYKFAHYVLSSYPKSIAKYIGLKIVDDLNEIIRKMPARKKRMITVIEDVLNLYIP